MALAYEQRMEEAEQALSRMEANVQVFSEAEKYKRTKLVRASIKKQVKVREMDIYGVLSFFNRCHLAFFAHSCSLLLPVLQSVFDSDLRNSGTSSEDSQDENDDNNDDNTASFNNLSNVCSICLESFEEGDLFAHANNAMCRHVFHEPCIVSWLVTRQNALCPCCRQPFACMNTKTPQTSITSLSEDGDGSRQGSVVAAGGGEDTMTSSPLDTLAIVVEDCEQACVDSDTGTTYDEDE
jgi:hypothetical protein